MFGHTNEPFTLSRDVAAIIIPAGEQLQFPVEVVVVDVTADVTITATVSGTGVDVDMTNNVATGILGSLPHTGFSTDRFAPAGVLMILLGSLLVFLSRRRREDEVAG